jgi:hypothetical protein
MRDGGPTQGDLGCGVLSQPVAVVKFFEKRAWLNDFLCNLEPIYIDVEIKYK